MKKLSARQRQILLFLLDRNGEATAAEIAEEAQVSVRTIHREMEGIESLFARWDIVLRRKSGKGIEIEGSPIQLDKLAAALRDEKPAEYSAEERKVFTISSLLQADEPVKLFAIAHSLKVTVPTITNDLNELESWINRFRIELIRRRGYGVELEGTEEDKRRAICELVEDNLDPSDLVGTISESSSPPLILKLLELAGKEYFMSVENVLWDLGSKWMDELTEKAYTRLLISLSVTVSRIHQHKSVGDSGIYHYRPRNTGDADKISAGLSEVLKMEFSNSEVKYIAFVLDRLEASNSSEYLSPADLIQMEIVQHLISGVAQKSGYPLQGDKSLREGLLQHIDPALERLRDGARIRNPLLSSIRKDYEPLFQSVKEVVTELDTSLEFPDEEIGFLVMHFGASIERLHRLQHNVRAVLVCSSGIGSAKLLATRLAKEIPQIEVIRNSSWYEAARIPEEEYDLVISTIDLPLPLNRYIRLSPLLTRDDIERLIDYIKNITFKQPGMTSVAGHPKGPEERKGESDWVLNQFKLLNTILTEIILLLDQFEVQTIDTKNRDIEYTIHEACLRLEEMSVITDEFEVTELLLERDRLGSLIIPDSSLALFHTRSHHVLHPSLSLFRLTDSVVMDREVQIQVILIMLGPRELPKESLEILSEISALLLRPELIELLERASDQEIRQFLSAELMVYYKNKV